MAILLISLAAVAVIAIVVYLLDRKNPQVEKGGEDGPMSSVSRRILIGYLLVVGVGLVYMLASLASADFPETSVQLATPGPSPSPAASASPAISPSAAATGTAAPSARASGTVAPNPSPAATATPARTASSGASGPSPSPGPAATPSPAAGARTPVLKDVFPQATVGALPTNFLTLYGEGFEESGKEKTVVRFNRQPRVTEFLTPILVKAQLQQADLRAGSMIVDVANGDRVSNAIIVSVGKPRVPVNVFGTTHVITREVQLILLVIFGGALGSYIHAIKSLSDFIGNRTAMASWFWWYITRPFLGAAMALVFYAVLRGGFLAGTPADANVVNHFGVIAIGALVGMFADKASQKLAEIFDTMFTAPDKRSGKLASPVIDKLDPPILRPKEVVDLVLKGDRLGKVAKVTLNNQERTPDTVSEKEVKVKLRPEDVSEAREIKVTAVNPDGGVSPALTIFVSDLDITTKSLPDAQARQAYSQKLAAVGGTPPYNWEKVGGPPWLEVAKTGEVTAKEPVVGTVKVEVRLKDDKGVSVTKPFDLKVA